MQLKTHPAHLQCAAIRALQQLASAAKAHIHTNRVHRRDREPATNFSSTWQQNDTQPQAPVGTAGPSNSVETDEEYKFFPTPHLGDAARGPQQTTLSPQVATHVKVDTAQQSMCDHFKAPARMRSIETDVPPNTNAQALLHIAYNGRILLKQALQHVVPMLNMIMHTLLPILATSAWLSLSTLATAMSIYAETSRTKQSSKFVQHHMPLQAFAILVSVLCMMLTLTMFVLTQLHCMLTLATAYSFLTHPHWISACLMMICGPRGMQQLLAGLTQAIERAVQSVVKHPKQPKFAHPKIRNGRYWRRVRNKTRWLHKQFMCKYVKALCWLHQFIQHAKTQHTKYPDTRARNSRADSKTDDEQCMHKQDKTRRQNSQDSNTTARHKCRNNHARKPKHQSKSAAHASRYTKKTKGRKAENLQVAVMMTATGGTQNASNTHFEAQYADAPEKNLMQMCKHVNVLCSCCNHTLNYKAITYSRTLDLNTKREETIVPMHTHRGGGQQLHIPDGEPDFGPNNDLYTPFSSSGREWLSSNHILKCVLYMLHMRYPNAKHHNMAGVTHPVACVQELLHKVKQANENSPLDCSTDISQALRDALSLDGPSPTITIRDNIHWRVMLINARRKHVDFVDPFGTGYLHSVRMSVQQFYQWDNTGTWTFTEWTKRLQPRGDTWNCGIWAIWIQEKWMQYWTQTEATETFADWLQQDVDMIPEGQDVRQHYHVVMQIADTAAEDGMTDLCQSREISASRMANQRDKQAL